jgi:hypothetical protein
MTTELDNTFGGTPLEGPISTVMNCVIGNKIAEVQKGLSWVYDNVQVSLPRINTNLITTNSTSATSLNSAASSLSSLLETAMQKLFREYKSELHAQLLISIAMIMLWMLLALCGFLYCFCHLKSSEKLSLSAEGPDQKISPYFNKRKFDPSPPLVEDGWSLNSFQPPSFTPVDVHNSSMSSPVNYGSPPVPFAGSEAIMEIKGAYPRQVEVRKADVARKSEYGQVYKPNENIIEKK